MGADDSIIAVDAYPMVANRDCLPFEICTFVLNFSAEILIGFEVMTQMCI